MRESGVQSKHEYTTTPSSMSTTELVSAYSSLLPLEFLSSK
jgi:hypothetical protein